MTCRGVCKSYSQLLVLTYEGDPAEIFPHIYVWKLHRQCIIKSFEYHCNGSPWSQEATWFMGPRTTRHCQGSIDFDTVNTHCPEEMYFIMDGLMLRKWSVLYTASSRDVLVSTSPPTSRFPSVIENLHWHWPIWGGFNTGQYDLIWVYFLIHPFPQGSIDQYHP